MAKYKLKRLKEIKTIYRVREDSNSEVIFDNTVNELLNAGWRIAEIKVIEAQGTNLSDVYYGRLEWWEA